MYKIDPPLEFSALAWFNSCALWENTDDTLVCSCLPDLSCDTFGGADATGAVNRDHSHGHQIPAIDGDPRELALKYKAWIAEVFQKEDGLPRGFMARSYDVRALGQVLEAGDAILKAADLLQ